MQLLKRIMVMVCLKESGQRSDRWAKEEVYVHRGEGRGGGGGSDR